MPSRYLRKGATKLKKCSERRTKSCGPETDGCCAVIPCKYCLTWEVYGGDIQTGTAEFVDTYWIGTIAGVEFLAYWEKNEYLECEFVVLLEGVEVYRKSCSEGQSCRDSSDSTEATIDYESGTLTWTKFEPRPLPAVEDPETRCRTHFCGDCHCTCECLCVTVDPPTGITVQGEICDISYSDCDAPEWSGTVGGIAISLTLDRDQETGGCILGGSIGSQEIEWTPISGCQTISASFTLDDYTVVSVACKECGCGGGPIVYPCECRRDGDIWEANLSAGSSPCAIDSPPISYTNPNTVPEAKRAWNFGDCVFGAPITYLITAFPPFCIDPNTSHFLVFVQKTTSGTTPFIDNDQVQENEWYAVVYDDTTFDIIGISYEYSTCCQNETPENAATSHLIWVQWDNLPFGGGLEYTVRMTNTVALAAYGDCA